MAQEEYFSRAPHFNDVSFCGRFVLRRFRLEGVSFKNVSFKIRSVLRTFCFEDVSFEGGFV